MKRRFIVYILSFFWGMSLNKDQDKVVYTFDNQLD